MPEVVIKNMLNETKGTMALPHDSFGLPLSIPLLHEVEQMQRACLRQGTAQTKTKGFVRGGGLKPWRQKGTGRARAGSRRSPLWKGGGTIFGPQMRSYAYAVPKKVAQRALFTALSSKVQEGKMVILEELALDAGKTRSMASLLERLQLHGKTLILVTQKNDEIDRASRNLPGVKLIETRQINTHDLLWADTVLTTARDLERFVETRRG